MTEITFPDPKAAERLPKPPPEPPAERYARQARNLAAWILALMLLGIVASIGYGIDAYVVAQHQKAANCRAAGLIWVNGQCI